MNTRTRGQLIADALGLLGTTDLARFENHADEPLRSLAGLTARAVLIHAYARGVVSDGERVHYLFTHRRDNTATATREDELERRARVPPA